MAKKVSFAESLAEEIDVKTPEVEEHTAAAPSEESEEDNTDSKFVLTKKKKQKAAKKTFPIYMEQDTARELDKVCNKTGYTRNELINKMIQFCLDNLELN